MSVLSIFCFKSQPYNAAKKTGCGMSAAVNVFQTDDVVFIQVIAGLNFDKFDVAVGGVFDPVFGFDRNENVFVGLFGQNFVAQGNQSGAFDNDPVFGPVVVQLKRKF